MNAEIDLRGTIIRWKLSGGFSRVNSCRLGSQNTILH